MLCLQTSDQRLHTTDWLSKREEQGYIGKLRPGRRIDVLGAKWSFALVIITQLYAGSLKPAC